MPTVGRFRKDGTLELIKSSISETLDVGGISSLSETNIQGKLTITGDTQAGIIDATTITAGAVAANTFAGDGYQITNINWANVSGTPTTIAGYGITDAYTKNETLTILDDAFNQFTTGLVWKQPVANYDEIILTYGPNGNSIPKDGWTVNTTEDNKTWRYDGNEWVAINAGVIPLANREHDGLMTAGHFIKLEDMPAQQFSTIKVGSTLIPAELGKNTLELAPGQNITITPNAAAKSLTIANTYKYTHPNHSGDVVSTGDGVTAIQANAVTNVKIIDDAISTTKIQNNAVSNTKLAKVGATTIKGNKNATTSDVADLTPTEVRAMLNVADGANNYTHPNHSGDIVSTGDGATVIQSLAVTSGKIANSAVIDSKIATSAVTSSKIGPGAVLTDKVSDLAITTAKIADNAIVEAKIADGSVTTGKIATLAITETKIADSSVTNAKLGNASVTSTKISGKSVTDDKLADMPTNTLKGVTTAGTPTNLNANVIRGILGIENVQDGAEPNQNAFSNIKIGLDTLSADTKSDTFEIKAGQYITTALDQANSRITVSHNSITTNAPTKSTNTGSANILYSTTVLNGHLTGGTYKTIVGGKDISVTTATAGDIVIANNYEYVHPTGDGSLHVPATGTTNSGKFLTAGSTAGALTWTTPPVATTSAAGYLNALSGSNLTFLRGDGTWATPALATTSAPGYLRALNNSNTSFLDGTGNWKTITNASDTTAGLIQFSGDTSHYLRGDGAWTTLPVYTRFGTGIDGLVPGRTHATGRTDYFLGEDGVWRQTKQYTVFTRSADGLVPKSGGVDGVSVKYLREDGTWQIPPDTTYSEFTGSDPGLVPNGAAYDGTYYLSGTGAWTRIPTATSTVLGTVKIGANINISAGTISIANYEPAFTKNTAFNKSFGGNGSATTVSRSDHYHTNLDVVDARSTAESPSTVTASKMLKPTFVSNATDGLSDGGSYHGVLTFRRWGSAVDMSGGQINQLGFTDNGNLWMRTSTSATAWGSWKKFLDNTYASVQTINVTDSITGGGTGTTISIGHSTSAGHKHLPTGGTVGQILQNSASGTGVWATMPTLTRGTYLTGANYNGSTATTWAVDANTSAVANKIVARDGNGYMSAMSVRSELANQTGSISGAALAYRTSASDGHIRFTTDSSAIRTWLNSDNLYAKKVTLTGQLQKASYRKSVIALCELRGVNTSYDSYSSGRISFHRANGLGGIVFADVNFEDQYAGDMTVNVSMLTNHTGIKPCRFIKNGKYYGGVEVYLGNAEFQKIEFIGTSNFEIFGLDYAATDSSGVLDSEVNGSIEFSTGVDKKLNDMLYNGNKLWNSSNLVFGTSANQMAHGNHTHALLTIGGYLTGSNYNGGAATTWAVDATETATASKIVARNSSSDILARLFRSEYANQTTISGAMAFRVNNSSDNYIRFCSDTAAIRAWLNVDAAGGSPVYVKKAGDTMTGTLTTKVAGIATALSGLTASISPIASSDVSVPNTGVQYVPMIHGSSILSGSGYRQHISIGHKRVGGSAWGNAYIAVGGNDAYPTKEWLFNGGSGAMTAPGSVTATGALITSDKLQSTKSGVTASISSENASYTHYNTTASTGHHFNKALYVAGEIYVGTSYNQRVYNTGWKPTKADVGLPNVKDVSLNWSWGTSNPTHIWGSQGDATQSYVYNGTQIKTFAGLGNVNNWGASSDIGANSTSQYATTNMVAQVRAEKQSINTTSGALAPVYYRTTSGNTTGSKIRLPVLTNSAKMLTFTIRMYQNYNHTDIQVSGYLYATTNTWHAPKATMISGTTSVRVVLGRDTDGYAYVWVSGAAYRGVAVLDVVGGFNSHNWNSGWTISESDSIPNIALDTTVYPPYSPNNKPTKADVGLGSVNNWGASSAIGANSTAEYATTNMVAQVRSGYLSYGIGTHCVSWNSTNVHVANWANSGFFNGSGLTNAPSSDWYYYLNMTHNNSTGYKGMIACDFHSHELYYGRVTAGAWGGWARIWNSSNFNPGNLNNNRFSTKVVGIDYSGNDAVYEIHKPGVVAYGVMLISSNQMAFVQTNGGGGWVKTLTSTDTAGNFTATGNVTAYSDIKLKKDLEIIQNPIEKIKNITGYTYTRIDSGKRESGVVAQDVLKVLPEVVHSTKPHDEDNDKTETLSVAYGNMVGLLIEGIKEQQKQIEEQQQQINELKEMLTK